MKFRVTFAVILLLLCQSAFAADERFGRVRNGTYINQPLGVKAYFDEDWKILSREEIATLYNIVPTAPTIREISQGNTPFFYAMSTDGLAHVTISVNSLGVVVSNAIDPKSSKKALDDTLKQLTKIYTQSYVEMGFTAVKTRRVDVKLAGKKYPGLSASAKANEVGMYHKMALCHKDKYIYSVSVMTFGFDVTDKLLSMFRPVASR